MLLRSSKKRSNSCTSSESLDSLTSTTTAGQRSSPSKRARTVPQQKARPQPHPSPKRSLLTLPYEIRNQILHGVLTSPASCHRWPHGTEDKVAREDAPRHMSGHNLSARKSRNRTVVYPAVLRTCKQLRDEGLPILYGNTLGMDLCINDDDDQLEFEGYDLSKGWNVIPRQARQQLFHLMRRLRITIHVEGDRDQSLPPLSTEESSEHRIIVSELCERLLEMPNMASLHLTIVVQNKHHFADDNEIGEQILTPLSLLRNVRCLTVTGVSSGYAQNLKCVMESHAYVQNLCAMRTALATYLGPQYCEEEGWDGVQEAVSICDVGLFYERRAEIVARIERQAIAAKERLYRFD
jgi:hypothetical protein